MPTPQQIAAAWHGVTDRWIVRQHWKYKDGRQWEVVHDWGVDVIDDATMELIDRFGSSEEAQVLADKLEDEARGRAVLALFQS